MSDAVPEMLRRIEQQAIAHAHELQMEYNRRDAATLREAKLALAKRLATFLRRSGAQCVAEDVVHHVGIEWRNTGHGTRLAPTVSRSILDLFQSSHLPTSSPVTTSPHGVQPPSKGVVIPSAEEEDSSKVTKKTRSRKRQEKQREQEDNRSE